MKVKQFIKLFTEPTIFYIYNEHNKIIEKCSIKGEIKHSECKIIKAKQTDTNIHLYVKEDKPFEIYHSKAEQELNLYNNLQDIM